MTMDDASADPVGTVRRTIGLIETALVKTTSVSLPWRRLDYTLSSDGLNFENLGGFSDEQAARFPVIGAVPGTPAAAGLLAAPTPTVDAIERIRQIIADHCFGPHVDSVAELRALEIAAACTDDMVDEGLLAASAAQPAPFTDLTARLAAADAGWGLASGDGPSKPDYIRWLAAQVDAFEGVASPAAPADDEATKNAVLKLADTIAFEAYRAWAASTNRDAYVDVAIRNAAKSVALAALREGQQK